MKLTHLPIPDDEIEDARLQAARPVDKPVPHHLLPLLAEVPPMLAARELGQPAPESSWQIVRHLLDAAAATGDMEALDLFAKLWTSKAIKAKRWKVRIGSGQVFEDVAIENKPTAPRDLEVIDAVDELQRMHRPRRAPTVDELAFHLRMDSKTVKVQLKGLGWRDRIPD